MQGKQRTAALKKKKDPNIKVWGMTAKVPLCTACNPKLLQLMAEKKLNAIAFKHEANVAQFTGLQTAPALKDGTRDTKLHYRETFIFDILLQ